MLLNEMVSELFGGVEMFWIESEPATFVSPTLTVGGKAGATLSATAAIPVTGVRSRKMKIR